MKNVSQHTGTLRIIERLNNSRNGNPRYLGYIDETGGGHGVSFYTESDSMYGYELPNYDDKQITVQIGTHYGKPTLHKIIKGL
jgi:hypothetical protein